MKSPVRLSEAANLAVHSMALMAAKGASKLWSATELARELKVSESHLAKVLQGLARKGVLFSIRGQNGGFRLKKAPEIITFLEIVEAVDGPMEVPGCLLGNPICPAGQCRLSGLHAEVVGLVASHLRNITLGQFVERETAAGLADLPAVQDN